MLANYQILDHLGTTSCSDLYRARALLDGTLVLLKRYITVPLEEVQHEYAILEAMSDATSLRPLSLLAEDDCLVIILEPVSGSLFSSILAQHRFSLPSSLRLANQFTRILAELHTAHLTFQDFRPANFLFDPDRERLYLADASRVSANPQCVVYGPDFKDWEYISPEQTGRTNRTVDYRTDFYSLGVMLYKMLTGQLPIQGDDPLEVIHGHIARLPSPLTAIAPKIPQMVSDIVIRLLAKLPEERYQSAFGLLIDLERCLESVERHGDVAPFKLGTQDVPERFHIAHKLYGREHEMQQMLDAFERVATSGKTAMVTIAGYPGIGKSHLMQELHRPIIERQGYFIGGKFDQYQHDVPYATLIQAFQQLVQQLLAESGERIAEWRQRILQAVGANGHLIIDVFPKVELIIGPQAPVPHLPPAETRHRLQRILLRFMNIFASSAHPLVVFLDDMQWIDAASLSLIERGICHPGTRHILLVGAYRDNEVTPSHPLAESLEKIRQSGVLMYDIKLIAPSNEALNQLIADTIHIPTNSCIPLSELIYKRTDGNPFFFTQFLDSLYNEGLLWRDAKSRAWKWNLDQIQAKDFADNAVDLIIQKLLLLTPEVQDVMRLAACLGNTFDIHRLLAVGNRTKDDVYQCLVTAIDASLIIHIGDSYKFLHDRIQQAAYSLIPQEERSATHLRIGRLLLSSVDSRGIDAEIYDIVFQLNRGAACIVDWCEKVQVAELNLRASRKAMAAAAFSTASGLLATGLTFLGEEGWIQEHTLTFNLTIARAHCEFCNSNFEETDELIAAVFRHSISPIEQASAYCQKIQLCLIKSENAQAVDHALACLRLFGIDLPPHPNRTQVEQACEDVCRLLNGRSVESLIDLPPMTDPHIQAAMQVLVAFIVSSFYTDVNLYGLAICQMVKLSLGYGNCEYSAYGYAAFGGRLLGPFFHRYDEGYRYSKLGCDLVEKNGFVTVKPRVYLALTAAAIWTQPLSMAIELGKTAISASIEIGDLSCACLSYYYIIANRLIHSDALDEIWQTSEAALAFANKAKYRDVVDGILHQQRFIENMRGKTINFSTSNDLQFDESLYEANILQRNTNLMIFRYLTIKLQICFMFGDYRKAMSATNEAKTYSQYSLGSIHVLDYHYYSALTVAALYHTAHRTQQRKWREVLHTHIAQLREWAENYPPTFRDKYALVAAEIARISGKESRAIRLYQEAINAASENNFLHNEGIAHELAARFFLDRGLITAGRAHLQAARSCYFRWGAHGKVKQIESHPAWQWEASPANAAQGSIAQLDVLSIMKASQAISGNLVLNELVDTLMRVVLESAGAQIGHLLLIRNGEWILTADARVEQHTIDVHSQFTALSADSETTLPATIINYVRRTSDPVLLLDATQPHAHSADPYFANHQPKSLWCLPIRRQQALLGILYLEHDLVTHAFPQARQTVLELLASQAAISLENALLYADLQQENSERKLAEEALRAAHEDLERRVRERTEELARSNADLEQFAYAASHDLQEPLRMVTSYLQLLEQRYRSQLDPDADEFIAFALDGARRMQGLIKDLLVYSRLNNKTAAPQPVDCQAVMEIVQRALSIAIEESGAQIEFASLPVVMGDETQLTQLFQNLVANAIKFRGEHPPRIRLTAEAEAKQWHFAVQDNGIGIAPEYFERIFVMFQRLHSRTQYPGTGIGLALCKKIVERHGGRIWVASSTEGSTFHFTLPCAKDKRQRTE